MKGTSFNKIDAAFKDRWNYTEQGNQANQPVRDLVWMEPNEEKPLNTNQQLPIKVKDAQNGVEMYFKLDEIQLGRFVIEE